MIAMFPGYGQKAKTPYTVEEKVVGVAKVFAKGGSAEAYMRPLCAKYGTKLGQNPKQMMSQWPKWVWAQLEELNREVIVLCIREKLAIPASIKAKVDQLKADNDSELLEWAQKYGVTL
jgi:hypothetical protein